MSTRMLEEINEQPEVLQRVLDEEWRAVRGAARTLRDAGLRTVVISARGTSDNAALYAKYLFEVVLGVPTALASPSVFTLYGGRMRLDQALVIGISQSGESEDVLETVRRARGSGAYTLSVTNDGNSSLAEVAGHHLCLRAGPERSVAATKTYTAELLLLYLLVRALKGDDDPDEAVRRVPDQARKVLEGSWESTARYRYAEHLVVVSRGYNLATAQEAALKLMEATYVVAEPFSAADFRHGPVAMVGRDFPVVAIVPPGEARSGMSALVEQLRESGAELVVIGDQEAAADAPASFVMPGGVPEELSPIPYALPAQLFAEDLARLKGLDPDAPRGLSKVTKTW